MKQIKYLWTIYYNEIMGVVSISSLIVALWALLRVSQLEELALDLRKHEVPKNLSDAAVALVDLTELLKKGVISTPDELKKPVFRRGVITDEGSRPNKDSVSIIPLPSSSPLPKPKNPSKVDRIKRSEWVVQVASQTSLEAAQVVFERLKNRFPNILSERSMSVQKANVNGSVFYRIRVQTSSRADANELCSNLNKAGGSCFVTR